MQNTRYGTRFPAWSGIGRFVEGPAAWLVTFIVLPMLLIAVLLLPPVNLLNRLQAFTQAFAVFPLNILFIEKGRVLQHDAAKITAGAVCKYGAAEARFYQHRQSTGVVDVGVTQYHGIDGCRIKREGVFVAFFVLAPTLDKAAIEQYAFVADGHQMTGAGDFFSGTENLDFYRHICSWLL